MKKIVRKISFLLLLLPGSMPVVFTVFFLFKQQIIRHEMKERLEEQILHIVVVPKENVTWIKYHREIRVGDKMFDVKSFSEKKGLIYFHGLFDEEETSLNELLDKSQNQDGKDQLADLIQWLCSPCIVTTADFEVINDLSGDFCFPILLRIPSPYINTPTPPPLA